MKHKALKSFVAVALLTGCNATAATPADGRIDRHALVTRHNVTIEKPDPMCALQVGNGEFAFGIDVTGLQTFYGNTLSQWGWHSSALPPGQKVEDYRWPEWDHAGRKIPYMTDSPDQRSLANWLYVNPHRLPLGRLMMVLTKSDGKTAGFGDLSDVHQELDMWAGVITSRFKLEGQPVHVQTVCDPHSDAVSAHIESPLIAAGKLKVALDFPYADERDTAPGMVGNWDKQEAHQTVMTPRGPNRADFARTVDASSYAVSLAWSAGASLKGPEPGHRHRYVLSSGTNELGFTCRFSPGQVAKQLLGFTAVKAASVEYWRQFWQSGGAIDLSGSSDKRWFELERRIVLSQYLMAVNEAGTMPPQESGLVCNSGWSGKSHLEMYWWHGAHYALWDRWPLWDRSLGYLKRIMPQARAIAAKQGYKGLRWPKMIGPEGRDSPNDINPLLIWQEPHPIFYAELDYRAHPTTDTLKKWRDIVFGTAEFMADFPVWNDAKQRYDLAPPLKTVPENTDSKTVLNPTFELSYWLYGLRTAQLWRERLGLKREPQWDKVLNNLAPLPQQNGVYLMQEGMTDTYTTRWNDNHPSLIGALGVLPGLGVDAATMHRTVLKVAQVWRWDDTWGWDFPMTAMCAAKAGEPKLAVEMLLHPSRGFQFNQYGLATRCFPYFPANGGLLYAVALMAAGWDGAPDRPNPGFPEDGSWVVKWEGLKKAP